jgi:hypothetical protein
MSATVSLPSQLAGAEPNSSRRVRELLLGMAYVLHTTRVVRRPRRRNALVRKSR